MGKREKTLCWDCRNACGGCSWSREFKPVKGWEAKPTKIKSVYGKTHISTCDSYIVLNCPEFVPDYGKRYYRITTKEISELLGISVRTFFRMRQSEIQKLTQVKGFDIRVNEEENRTFYVSFLGQGSLP